MRYIALLLIFCAQFAHARRCSWEMELTTYPLVSVNVYKEISDHQFDQRDLNPLDVQEGDIIYSSVARLTHFFNNIHPHIRNRYILVTTYSDRTMPSIYKNYLNDPQIAAWYSQNANEIHPKMHFIPIGIRPGIPQRYQHYPYFKRNRTFFQPKERLLYSNFYLYTNTKARKPLRDMMLKAPYCLTEDRIHYTPYIANVENSSFILSPPGAGVDCYRTWEALMVGSIPIILKNFISDHYRDLPVLVVDNWSDISQEFLEEKLKEMSKQSYNYDKMYADYWLNAIEGMQHQLRGTKPKNLGKRPYLNYSLLSTNSRLREIAYKQVPKFKIKSWYFYEFTKEVVEILGSLGTGTRGFLPYAKVERKLQSLTTQAVNHMIAQRLFLVDSIPDVEGLFLISANEETLNAWLGKVRAYVGRSTDREVFAKFAEVNGLTFDSNNDYCWVLD